MVDTMTRRVGAGVLALVAACGVVPLAGCVKNEATGKSIFTMGMSAREQISLGSQAAPQFTKEMGGSIPDSRLQAYVDRIGRDLASHTEGKNKEWPWEFNLVNTSQVNAFALPGGKVFFTRGLAERLTTEAQMAGVIGHEIGHVVAEHGAQRIAQQTAFNVGLVATAVLVGVGGGKDAQRVAAVGIPALAIGGNLMLLKYGREEELEADALGVRYMTRSGYNPRGQMEVMQVLAKLSQGAKQPEFLSTHPDPNARVQAIQRMLQGEYAFTQGDAKYQDFADRYKTEFLDVIKTLPAPPQAKQALLWITPEQAAASMGMTVAQYEAEFNYEDPTTWCAHCRTAAIVASESQQPQACAAAAEEAPATARGLLARAALSAR